MTNIELQACCVQFHLENGENRMCYSNYSQLILPFWLTTELNNTCLTIYAWARIILYVGPFPPADRWNLPI